MQLTCKLQTSSMSNKETTSGVTNSFNELLQIERACKNDHFHGSPLKKMFCGDHAVAQISIL